MVASERIASVDVEPAIRPDIGFPGSDAAGEEPFRVTSRKKPPCRGFPTDFPKSVVTAAVRFVSPNRRDNAMELGLARILGLDAGIASVGWAMIDDAEHHIIATGSWTFSAPENPKDRTSLNAARGEQRRQRRVIRRRRQRMQAVRALLAAHGLLESAGRDALHHMPTLPRASCGSSFRGTSRRACGTRPNRMADDRRTAFRTACGLACPGWPWR